MSEKEANVKSDLVDDLTEVQQVTPEEIKVLDQWKSDFNEMLVKYEAEKGQLARYRLERDNALARAVAYEAIAAAEKKPFASSQCPTCIAGAWQSRAQHFRAMWGMSETEIGRLKAELHFTKELLRLKP